MRNRLLLPMLLCALPLYAQSTAPGTLSATQPGVQPGSQPATQPDLSSPRSTLTGLYRAMAAGDVETIKACFAFDDKEAAEIADATLGQRWLPRQVAVAAVARFGEDARKAFGTEAQDKELAEAIARAASAEIKVQGEVATVAGKRQDPHAENELTGVTLKKLAAGWKIVPATYSDLASDVKPGELALMRATREAMAGVVRQTVADIEAGKFRTAQEAYEAYQSRAQDAARKAAAAATQK